MCLERITSDDAAIIANQRLESIGALVITNAMHDDSRRGQAPHLPRLVAFAIEPRPARLIEPYYRLREHTGEQGSRRRLEPSAERAQLIP